jgi:hypothetical protein
MDARTQGIAARTCGVKLSMPCERSVAYFANVERLGILLYGIENNEMDERGLGKLRVA